MPKSMHDRNLCANCLKEEYEDFRHICVHESQDKNDDWFARYGVDSYPRWDYEMHDATLTFSGGTCGDLICKMQVVGSHHGSSWEWSWGNPNLPIECRTRMEEVRAFGEEKGWLRLSTLFLDYDGFVGWECVSIASHVLSAIGVYRCGDEEDAVWVAILSCAIAHKQADQH